MSVPTESVVAAAHLVARAGAVGFEIAWDCPHTPDEGDNHNCPDITWTCSVQYRGHRIFTAPHPHPDEAANALAAQILTGAMCRCGEPVDLFDGKGCRWTRQGDRWVPGCDAPPLSMAGVERGDLAGMNRAARRRTNQRKKR